MPQPGAFKPKKDMCEMFARIYMFEAGFNATQAMRILRDTTGMKIADSSLNQYGSCYLNNPQTQAALERLKEENAASFEAQRELVMSNLLDMATAADYTPKTRLDALDKLCRITGMYNDSLEMKGNQTISVALVD
ncbi:hypothetical protein H7U31_02270 [Olsenella uli]|nr:hypothetical protein [Olsenella uli]